jgi:microcystin-dependent protein
MNNNKLKTLLIAICCSVFSLWADAQCMEDQIKNDVPAGSICSFAGDRAPNGWLLCDGVQYSSREYPKLYEVIKTKYVPANERLRILQLNEDSDYKLFCVPDLRGRVIVGVDRGAGRITSNNELGASGGEEKHQLTINELAEHSHDHNYGTNNGGNSIGYSLLSAPVTSTNKESAKSTGGNQPHNNMQPYQVLNYIISTGRTNNQFEISQKGCAKAWVVFNGSNPNALNSYGVSSVVKVATGQYRINFSKPFKSENYCAVLNAGSNGLAPSAACGMLTSGPFGEAQTRYSFRFLTWIADYNSPSPRHDPSFDPVFVSACFYGDQ